MEHINMKVMPVDKSEHKEIIDVWEASVKETHDFLSENDIEYFRSLIFNEYLSAVELHCVRGNSNEILGFIGATDRKVEMLFLLPDYRRKGIGKMLLNFAVTELRINSVDVNEQNTEALKFYKKMGFKVVSRSPVDNTGKPYPILHMELRC